MKSKKIMKSVHESWGHDELNYILARAETDCLKETYNTPRYPVVFIVGAPGSGTTLFFQWLASTGAFAYPSNLMARFDRAPFIASKINCMLSAAETTPGNELALPPQAESDFFSSCLGKTHGLFAPNDFFGFWQRFFPFGKTNQLSDEQLAAVDWKGFKGELAAMEGVFNKPLALKTLPGKDHLLPLAEKLKNALFIHIRRQPFYNVQSLLLARKQITKSKKDCFGKFYPQYPDLKNLNIYKQVCGQLYHTDLAVTKGLKDVPGIRILDISYEKFCNAPESVWDELNSRFNRLGFTMHRDYSSVRYFEARNKLHLSKREKERLSAAYYSMFGEDITPPELRSNRKKRR